MPVKILPKLDLYDLSLNSQGEFIKVADSYFETRQANHFPIILNKDGSIWADGSLYLLSRIDEISPISVTSIAYDISPYKDWCDDTNTDYLNFNHHRRTKFPTFKYIQFLRDERVLIGDLDKRTAKRQALNLVRFYEWLDNNVKDMPDNIFGKKVKKQHYYVNNYGRKNGHAYCSYELISSIEKIKSCAPKKSSLKAINKREQELMMQSLSILNNVEMRLIYLLGLTTGARKQTILTMPPSVFFDKTIKQGGSYSVPVGRGTTVDTKYGSQYTLKIPAIVVKQIQRYLLSERYNKRKEKSLYENSNYSDEQYAFLNKYGNPYYLRKKDKHAEKYNSRPEGRAVNAFNNDYLLPLIHKSTTCQLTYHTLRATFGVDMARSFYNPIEKSSKNPKKDLYLAHNEVRKHMGHKSISTTHEYIFHGYEDLLIKDAQNEFEEFVESIVNKE